MVEKFANPMGTDGFEFIEFTTLDPEKLITDFKHLGFTKIAKHKSKNVQLYRQGKINFILNLDPDSYAHDFAKLHGASACAMGFRVKDAKKAFDRAVSLGAKPYTERKKAKDELDIPAIYGIGDSLIYFIDKYNGQNIYAIDFEYLSDIDKHPVGCGLTYIDHLTHNLHQGEMDIWYDYYHKLFNFREIRFFDIKGKMTGLVSRALTSPCGKIKIPLNESTDDKSQIEEFLHEFNGEGIQHIALGTDNIYDSIEKMRANGLKFLTTPDTYYENLDERIPWHKENLKRMQEDQILMDGTPTPEGGLLLQIFTENMLGPVFFEIIQRKGNEGFGEGNFQALFEAIERDQMRRGVL